MFEKCKNLVYMNEYGTEFLVFLPMDFDQISQLYDTLSLNI